ncbi:MAG: glycoside hydrolase family 30 beta sandwich domain-containing protein [Gemmatimonadales bacterium]
MIVRIWTIVATILTLGCDGGQTKPIAPEEPVIEGPAPQGPEVQQPATATATITIEASQTHQEIQGFGTSMRIFSDPHLINLSGGIENSLDITIPEQDAILKTLYEGIGLTRVRPLHQTTFSQPDALSPIRTDWVFADGHIELVKRARQLGLKEWWLSPIALESWMNNSRPSEYVQWAMKFIRYWKSRGVELTYYSIVNEPSFVKVSGVFVRDAVKLLGKQLADEGFKTRIVIPDDFNPQSGSENARIILRDPEARKYVGALAVHLYGNGINYMDRIAAVAEEYGLPLWMSEFSFETQSPLDWASLVHTLIAEYNVSAVDYMWGFFGDYDGAQLVSIAQDSKQFRGATLRPSAYGMAQYAKYVRPGAKRVSATSSLDSVRATAFVNDGKMTIVVLNLGGTPVSVRFNANGAGSGLQSMNLVRTSSSENLAAVGHVVVTNGTFNLELPARSISTLVQ